MQILFLVPIFEMEFRAKMIIIWNLGVGGWAKVPKCPWTLNFCIGTIFIPWRGSKKKWKKIMTFAIRRLTAPPLPQSDGTHFHFPFQKYTKKIYGRSSPILEPFFLRGGREVAGKKNVRFCCCFWWPWWVVEMVMLVKTMVKMILLMERLMMKMSNAWIWGGGCQGEN